LGVLKGDGADIGESETSLIVRSIHGIICSSLAGDVLQGRPALKTPASS
jgi:hypothetical protein